MTKILGTDVDGVCANLHTPWLGDYNKDWQDNLQLKDITDWNIHQFAKPECGAKGMYKYIEDPSLYDRVEPIENALISINLLKKFFDVRIVYITSSTRGTMGRKYDWLKQYGFIDNLDDYVEMKDKSLINTDYLLDDYHGNLINFKGRGFLFDSPWNYSANINATRVYNWNNFMDVFTTELLEKVQHGKVNSN